MPETYLFNRDDLGAVFGDLRRIERIKQRIFHLNVIGEPLGIKLSFSSVDSTLAIHASSAQAMLKLCQRLTKGKGHIQRGLGQLLARKVGVPVEQIQRMAGFLSKMGESRPPGLNQLALADAGFEWNACWVNPVIKSDIKFQKTNSSSWDSVLGRWLASKPDRPLLLRGGAGSGKSFFLRQVWEYLSQQYQSGAIDRPPILVNSAIVRKDAQNRLGIFWGALSGISPDIEGHLRELFESGRLILLIDAIDENPNLVDWSDVTTVGFWSAALKNSCVIAARTSFWSSDVKVSSVDAFRQAYQADLEPWNLSTMQAFFHESALVLKSHGSNQAASCLEHLGRLDVVSLEQFLSPVPKNALIGALMVSLLAFRLKGQLPRNGFELASYIGDALMAWETAKPGCYLKKDTAVGILERLAWKSCAQPWSGRGPWLPLKALWEEVRSHYPFFEGHAGEFFAALARMPFLSYEGDRERFSIEPWAASVLAARFLLQEASAGSLPAKKELMRTAIISPTVIFQALEELDWQIKKSGASMAKVPLWIKKINAALRPLLRVLRKKRRNILNS